MEKKVILPIGLVVDGTSLVKSGNLLSKEYYYKITKFMAIEPLSNEILNLPIDDINSYSKYIIYGSDKFYKILDSNRSENKYDTVCITQFLGLEAYTIVLNGKKSDKDIVIDKWCPIHSESDLPLTKSFIGVTSSILLENKLRLDFEFPSLDFRVKSGHSIKLRNTPFLLHDKDTAISLFKNTFKEEDSYIYEYKDVYVVDYGNTSDTIKLPKECSYLALNSEGEYLKTLYLHRNLNGLSYTNPHTFKNLKNVYVDGIILDRDVLNSLFKFLQLASGINRGVVLSGAGYEKITEKYMRDVASNTGKIELDVNGIKAEFRFDLKE